MANYIYIENYTKNGMMGISRHVFEQIAIGAINNVQGASVSKTNAKGKSRGRNFMLYNPINVTMRKEGRVDINVDVSLKRGTDVNAVCTKIQEEIANSLLTALEIIPFNINIKVVSIEG